jgi:peptidoglycan/xylan/chitin deacetylase (PgdA/CDA1 family)
MKKLRDNKEIKIFLGTALLFVIIISGCGQKKVIANYKNQEIIPLANGIIEHGPRDKKMIALTFDADMTQSMQRKLQTKEIKTLYDKKIIEILEETSTPATIFITGLWAENYPLETRSISQNSLFEIANHSLTHGSFTENCYTLGQVDDKNKELIETQKILLNLTGKTPRFFRFPGGCYEKKDLKIVNNVGLESVQWDVISGDAYLKDSTTIANTVINKTTNGSIIVMHLNGAPNAPGTAKALPSIIKELKGKGYTFVKLADLLN